MAEGLGDPAEAAGGAVGEAAAVHETGRPPYLAVHLADLADLSVHVSGEAERDGGAAALRATAADAEGGGLGEESSSAGLEPLRAYEQTKRRVPSWCRSECE